MKQQLSRKATATTWRRFRRKAALTSYGREDACLSLPCAPLTMELGAKRPTRLLYCTKASFLRLWRSFETLPDELAVFAQGGIPSRHYCQALRMLTESYGLPLLFVGDLDPLDLTIFAALQSGTPELKGSSSTAVPAQYLGIDDRWLALCRRHATMRRMSLDAISIKMEGIEREHFEVVKQVVPDLERIIGPESLELLESGR